jgi:hypothetical protein
VYYIYENKTATWLYMYLHVISLWRDVDNSIHQLNISTFLMTIFDNGYDISVNKGTCFDYAKPTEPPYFGNR